MGFVWRCLCSSDEICEVFRKRSVELSYNKGLLMHSVFHGDTNFDLLYKHPKITQKLTLVTASIKSFK